MAVVWSSEQILTLIELYQNSQILWDTSKKNDAWESIATTLNKPRKDVEGKIHNIRSQFLRERKKIASSKSTGSASGDVHKSNWFAYDSLLFLVKGATSSGSMDSMNAQTSESSVAHEEIPAASQVLTQPPEAPTSPPPLPTQPMPLTNTQNKRKKDDLSEVYEIMKSAKARMDQPKDEYQIYADYIASELRNIKNEHAVLQTKYFINNILLEARMGKYNYTENAMGSNSSDTQSYQSYGYRSASQQSSYSTNSVNNNIVTANASHVNNDNGASAEPTHIEFRQFENIQELVSHFESETQNKE
ncbi:spastin-like [Plodia interpunctella]|uniref:spastin-like n=1 Tax=Plodia interpunctella TaxID=58824 RepID=UPI0023674BEC|nr:spastin-like [Plodia interpunctella]